jgi:hypothetical protein
VRALALGGSELFVGGDFSEAGSTFSSRIAVWHTLPVGVDPDIQSIDAFALSTPYPNPFGASAQVEISLPEAGHVRLDAYDLLGRRVAMIVDEHYPAGGHTIEWDASDLAPGVYLIRMTSGALSQTRRVTVVR